MIKYPQAIPTDCIRKVIDIITSGDVVSDMPRLLKEVWVIQGWIQGVIVGDPDEAQITFGAAPGCSEADCIHELSELSAALGEPIPKGGIKEIVLAALAKRVLALVMKKLEEWLADFEEKKPLDH